MWASRRSALTSPRPQKVIWTLEVNPSGQTRLDRGESPGGDQERCVQSLWKPGRSMARQLGGGPTPAELPKQLVAGCRRGRCSRRCRSWRRCSCTFAFASSRRSRSWTRCGRIVHLPRLGSVTVSVALAVSLRLGQRLNLLAHTFDLLYQVYHSSIIAGVELLLQLLDRAVNRLDRALAAAVLALQHFDLGEGFLGGAELVCQRANVIGGVVDEESDLVDAVNAPPRSVRIRKERSRGQQSFSSHRVILADRPDALEDHRGHELHLLPGAMAVAGLENGRRGSRSRTLDYPRGVAEEGGDGGRDQLGECQAPLLLHPLSSLS
jgi:hypothetical protein